MSRKAMDRIQLVLVFIFINLFAVALDKAISEHFAREWDR